MNAADLASMLELMAQALRALPAGMAPAPVAQLFTPAAQAAPVRTMGEWLDVHEREMAAARGYKAQTLRNKHTLMEHCRRLWGERPIAQIKPHEIAAGLRTFGTDHASTAARVLAEVRDAFADAIAAGWCETNPAAPIKPPKHPVIRQRLPLDTWCSMYRLAQVGPPWLSLMLLLALVTGQRRGDLVKMRESDIVDGCLRVEQQKEAGKGFGARVAIPLELRLDAIGLTVGQVIERCRTSGRPGPTLLRKSNGEALDVGTMSNSFAQCCSAVLGKSDPGPRRRPSLHEVRSLSTRLYLDQGLDIKMVQTLMGHKSADMTEFYANDRGLSAKVWKRVQLPAPTSEPSSVREVAT